MEVYIRFLCDNYKNWEQYKGFDEIESYYLGEGHSD